MLWNPAGGTEEEQQAIPEGTLSGSSESQAVQDSPPMNLAEVLQVSPSLLIRFSLFSQSTLLIILRAKFGYMASNRSIRVLRLSLSPWLHLALSPLHTHVSASAPACPPSMYTGRVLTLSLLHSAHAVLFFSGGDIWKGIGTDRQTDTHFLKLSQRKGWGLCWVLHDASSLGRKPRRGGSDTFLDLPT